MALSQEQPPFDVDEGLREYLIRFRTDIDNELRKASKFPERVEQPPKPQKGDVHYFGDPVTHNYDAAILVEGFWGYNNTGWVQLDGGAGGASDLQGAYDADTSVPQIDINATPDPLTIDATVAGDVFAVRGFTDLDLLRVATNGSTFNGGHNNGDQLTLQGSLGADLGEIVVESPIQLDYDGFNGLSQYALVFNPTVAINGAYVGGCLQVAPVHNVTTGTYIPATFSDTMTVNQGANPGFSAHTFINELALIQNNGNFNLPQSFTINVGLVHSRITSGTSTTPNIRGLSFSPQTRATVSGAVMTKTNQQGVVLTPTFSSVFGSTVNLGTIVGMQCQQPAVALFQPQAGVENMTAYYGLYMFDQTFGGANRIVNGMRSLLNAATNVRCINHTGNAASTHNGQFRFEADLVGITFGASQDFQMGYAGADFFFMQQLTGNTGQLRLSSETPGNSSQRWLFNSSDGSDNEFNFNCEFFSIGAQTGSVGNQVGVFVAGTRTTQINGDWSDFLLTQAGNLTLNNTMGTVAAWTINAPSLSAGTGSATNATALLIGGNPGQATQDRTGLRIISNPSGGAGVNAALYVTAGRSRFDGIVDLNQPIALGGGAAATLGTIGGSGPTAAAQAQWVQIEVNGVNHWIPAWT